VFQDIKNKKKYIKIYLNAVMKIDYDKKNSTLEINLCTSKKKKDKRTRGDYIEL
jgi:hypothetical protein